MPQTRFALCLLSVVTLSACTSNEQTGQLFGTGTGALLGGALGQLAGHNTRTAALGAVLGGASGYFVGGQVGRSLDARDREIASLAAQQVLNQPVDPATLGPTTPAYQPGPPGPPGTLTYQPRPPSYIRATVMNAIAKPPADAPAVHWKSDHSGAQGTVTVMAAHQTTAGGECKTISQVAYIAGKEIAQDQQYCRTSPSMRWTVA